MVANLSDVLNTGSNIAVIAGTVCTLLLFAARSVVRGYRMAKTLEEHGQHISDLKDGQAELKSMLQPNGKNTTNPGDMLAILLDEVRDLKEKVAS